jgi:hypothetical protein
VEVRTMKRWGEGAPAHLIRLYESGKVGSGRVVLKRLLSAPQMKDTWCYLARKVRTDQDWGRVWGSIAYAKLKSSEVRRAQVTRSAERASHLKIASAARVLAGLIGTNNNPLDVLAYRLFPADVLAALHVADLNDRPPPDRDAAAHRLLPCWPSASELLEGLAALAEGLAKDAMTRPRPVARQRGDPVVRTFAWHLGKDFKMRYDESMYGTVASIASALFVGVPVTTEFVREVLRRT